MRKIFLLIIIGIVLIGILSGAYYFLKYSQQEGFIKTDKPLKNTSVTLDNVYLIRPGYVVVHENNNGEPGEIIGVSEFITGVEENLIIFINKNVDSVVVKIYYGRDNFPLDIKDFKIDKSKEATIVINK